MGLATVYGIVQQTQGEITIESTPRKGTQINILLPVSTSDATVSSEGPDQIIKNGQGSILLVEDEADLRNVNAEFLSSLGYTLMCASSGPEALQLAAAADQIDLVISDVVMPKMSGREFADQLLQIRPNTKLLYVSGYADDVVLQNGVSMHGMLYLQKPYSLKQLASKVHNVCRGGATPLGGQTDPKRSHSGSAAVEGFKSYHENHFRTSLSGFGYFNLFCFEFHGQPSAHQNVKHRDNE